LQLYHDWQLMSLISTTCTVWTSQLERILSVRSWRTGHRTGPSGHWVLLVSHWQHCGSQAIRTPAIEN